jgi:dihydrolipoamide dehydrogenase
VYAAGDVTGHGHYTHVSTTQGRIAAHNMLHRDKVIADYSVVPRTVYAWPEIAAVGATTEELKAKKRRFSIVTLPISVIARSMITGDDVGFVKILANADGHILGASIMAPRATDMITELALAMQYKITVQQIANTVHAFPSWSDAIRVACAQF